jgi:hypothetical protein
MVNMATNINNLYETSVDRSNKIQDSIKTLSWLESFYRF